jgi:hypothetical protein
LQHSRSEGTLGIGVKAFEEIFRAERLVIIAMDRSEIRGLGKKVFIPNPYYKKLLKKGL